MTYEEFSLDGKTYDAVLQNLIIIGEAANKIPEVIKDRYQNIEWNKIIGMRNIIVHGYFNIDASIIWKTIKEKMEDLFSGIKEIK